MIDDSRYFRQATLGRLRQADFTGAKGPLSALGLGGPQAEFADGDVAAFTLEASPPAASSPETVWWTQGVGAWGTIDGNGNAAEVSHSLGGFFTGVDHGFGEHWRGGIAGGYANSNVNDSARASSAGIDTAHLGAYTGATYGPWNFRAGGALSWSTINTNRSILFPGFADSASAHYGATTTQLFDELGYGIALGSIAVEPFAGLAWVHLATDGFSETAGTSAALSGSSSTNDIGYSTLGTRVAATYGLPNGMALTTRASVAWQHAFGEMTPNAVLAFEGTQAAFTVSGVPLASDAALVETGFDILIAPRVTVGVSFAGQFAGGVQDYSIKGSLLIKF